MQQQTSALQRLAKILNDAILNSLSYSRDAAAIPILLQSIDVPDSSSHFIDFFSILSTAREEIRKMKGRESSCRVIEKLNDYFINNINITWKDFAKYIDDGNIIDLLHSLADHYHTQNPTIFLESDFLDRLEEQFNSLLDEIIDSDLSNNLKRFLTKQIENILYAIRRYSIDGTEGLEKAIKSFVTDLVMVEKHIDKKDKKNPIYSRCLAGFSSLLVILRPSPYDVIGVVPAIDDYYRPRIEEFIKNWQEVEENTDETSTITEIMEKSLQLSNKQPQKSLQGKEQKSLPSSQINEEPPLEMEANLEDEDNF